jgi:hypothetical protein
MLIYPKLTPPEKSAILPKIVSIYIIFKREGLQDFVRGLIQGLGKMYNTPVTINLVQTRDEGSSHEILM